MGYGRPSTHQCSLTLSCSHALISDIVVNRSTSSNGLTVTLYPDGDVSGCPPVFRFSPFGDAIVSLYSTYTALSRLAESADSTLSRFSAAVTPRLVRERVTRYGSRMTRITPHALHTPVPIPVTFGASANCNADCGKARNRNTGCA